MTPSNEELLDAFGKLFMSVKEHFERKLEPFDLPAYCAKALHMIDGSISMKELGGRIQCDASFVTAIADTLEERGLVRREIDKDDRRIKNLVITAGGRKLRAKLADHVFGDVPCFDQLDAGERESLLKLLRKMAGDREGAAVSSPR